MKTSFASLISLLMLYTGLSNSQTFKKDTASFSITKLNVYTNVTNRKNPANDDDKSQFNHMGFSLESSIGPLDFDIQHTQYPRSKGEHPRGVGDAMLGYKEGSFYANLYGWMAGRTDTTSMTGTELMIGADMSIFDISWMLDAGSLGQGIEKIYWKSMQAKWDGIRTRFWDIVNGTMPLGFKKDYQLIIAGLNLDETIIIAGAGINKPISGTQGTQYSLGVSQGTNALSIVAMMDYSALIPGQKNQYSAYLTIALDPDYMNTFNNIWDKIKSETLPPLHPEQYSFVADDAHGNWAIGLLNSDDGKMKSITALLSLQQDIIPGTDIALGYSANKQEAQQWTNGSAIEIFTAIPLGNSLSLEMLYLGRYEMTPEIKINITYRAKK